MTINKFQGKFEGLQCCTDSYSLRKGTIDVDTGFRLLGSHELELMFLTRIFFLVFVLVQVIFSCFKKSLVLQRRKSFCDAKFFLFQRRRDFRVAKKKVFLWCKEIPYVFQRSSFHVSKKRFLVSNKFLSCCKEVLFVFQKSSFRITKKKFLPCFKG